MKVTESPDLPDDAVDSICGGLVQNAAKVRFLKSLGLSVNRRPNGRPLVARSDWENLHKKNETAKASTTTSAPRWKKPVGG